MVTAKQSVLILTHGAARKQLGGQLPAAQGHPTPLADALRTAVVYCRPFQALPKGTKPKV